MHDFLQRQKISCFLPFSLSFYSVTEAKEHPRTHGQKGMQQEEAGGEPKTLDPIPPGAKIQCEAQCLSTKMAVAGQRTYFKDSRRMGKGKDAKHLKHSRKALFHS